MSKTQVRVGKYLAILRRVNGVDLRMLKKIHQIVHRAKREAKFPSIQTLFKQSYPFLDMRLGSFSNDNGDGNENVTNIAYLVGKNNSFARPARAFFIFVHFFAVVSKETT